MPRCPGCERGVPFDRLDVHQRHCRGIWGEAARSGAELERLERRLRRLEESAADRESGWEGLAKTGSSDDLEQEPEG